MRKIIAFSLAITMLCALALPAIAILPQEERLPLIIVNGMGESPLLTPSGESAFLPSSDAITQAVLNIVPLVPLLAFNTDLFGDFAYPILRDLFDDIAFLPGGTPKYELGQVRFPDSYAEDKTGMINTISHGGLARLYGEERSYQYVIDWRKSGLEEAGGLHEMIQRVKREHNTERVNLIAVSMGGKTALGYLARYGHGDIHNLTFMHSVFQGMLLVGDLFNGRLTFGNANMKRFLDETVHDEPLAGIINVLWQVFDMVGAIDGTLGLVERLAEALMPRLNDEFITPIFGQLPGFWGLVPGDDFESAKELLLDPAKHSSLIEMIDDYHYNAYLRAGELFAAAMEDGRNIYVLSGYNLMGFPIGPRADAHTDDGLSTATTSGGAIVAPLGQALGNHYKQAVNCGHNHICPDNFIDASTCLLPEHTWFQKNLGHADFRSEECLRFLLWLLASEERLNVRSNPAYPQFTLYEAGRLLPLGGGESLGGHARLEIPPTGDHAWVAWLLVAVLGASVFSMRKLSKQESP